LTKLIKKLLGSKSKIIVKPSRKGEIIKYVADISKVKKFLNYKPKVGIIEEIKKSIKWYKLNLDRIKYFQSKI